MSMTHKQIMREIEAILKREYPEDIVPTVICNLEFIKGVDNLIEWLKDEACYFEDKIDEINYEKNEIINRQQAEIERLKQEATELQLRKEMYRVTVDEVRAEAIREFAERLKETNLYEFIEEYFDNAELCYEVRSDLFNDFVDNLVKEMMEKEGGKG